MATINPSVNDLSKFYYGSVVTVYTFSGMANGDVGAPIQGPGWADRSFQVEGNFGVGGQVTIEGSNDGVNFRTLDDPFGNQLLITFPSIRQLTEISLFVRPRISAGDRSTLLNVIGLVGRHGYP